jgi:hypothetical protein
VGFCTDSVLSSHNSARDLPIVHLTSTTPATARQMIAHYTQGKRVFANGDTSLGQPYHRRRALQSENIPVIDGFGEPEVSYAPVTTPANSVVQSCLPFSPGHDF